MADLSFIQGMERAAQIADEVAREYGKKAYADMFNGGAECAAEQIARHIRREAQQGADPKHGASDE